MKKKTGIQNTALFAALIIALAFSGCSDPFTPPAAKSKKTTATITLSINGGGGERTIMPVIGQFPKVLVTFDNGTEADKIGPETVTGGSVTKELKAGTWTVTAEGYLEAGVDGLIDATKPVAVGTQQFTIGGALSAQTINIVLVADKGGKGTFEWNITGTVAAGIGVTVKIEQLNSDMTKPESGFSDSYTLGADKDKPLHNTLELDVGFYAVTFELSRGGKTVEWKELLYIYRNMKSSYEQEFTTGWFTETLLDIVLEAVKTNDYLARSAAVTDAHFTLLGVNKLVPGNFQEAKTAFVGLIAGNKEPTTLTELKALADAALIKLALGAPGGIKTLVEIETTYDPTTDKEKIETDVKALVAAANNTFVSFDEWEPEVLDGHMHIHETTVTVGGKYAVEVSLTISPKIDHITATHTSVKKDYYQYQAEDVDLDGLIVQVHYNDLVSFDTLSDSQYNVGQGGFGPDDAGEYIITVTYGTHTADFTVIVHALSSLAVGSPTDDYVFDNRPTAEMIRNAITETNTITVEAVYENGWPINIGTTGYLTVASGNIVVASGGANNDTDGYSVTIKWPMTTGGTEYPPVGEVGGTKHATFTATLWNGGSNTVTINTFDITDLITSDKAGSIINGGTYNLFDFTAGTNGTPHPITVTGATVYKWRYNNAVIAGQADNTALQVNTRVAPFNQVGTFYVTIEAQIGGKWYNKTVAIVVEIGS